MKTFLWVSLLLAILPAVPALAAPTLLDFEDQPAPSVLTAQYGRRGVVFPLQAYLRKDAAARSGTQVVYSDNPANEFNTDPLVIQFTAGQSRVSLFAGSSWAAPANPKGTLKAFDAAGALVAQDGPKTVGNQVLTTQFSVSLPSATIVRVELKIGVAEFEVIDDLQLEGATGRPPTTPPVVRIGSPTPGQEIDGASVVDVSGTVEGEQLLPLVTVRFDYAHSPEDSSGPTSSTLTLTGAGTQRTFRTAWRGVIPSGPLLVMVEAENTAGLKGSAAVSFGNLPAAIRDRYGKETGLGPFRWGAETSACRIAVYQQGAIALAGGATRLIRGDVFDKWLSLRDPVLGAVGRLGCPTTEQRILSGGVALAQDFEKGRVYARLPTGHHYVPQVFVEALDKLGGEAANGFPIADPTWYTGGPFPVWLFQRFSRPGMPGLPSTFEIRGTPPVLWIERQGGDLATLRDAGLDLVESTPTIWQSFPCTSAQGPCTVDLRTTSPAITDGGPYCSQGSFRATGPPLEPPAWKSIRGDHVPLAAAGFVEKSFLSAKDHPLVHDNMVGLKSDWNVKIRPFPVYRELLAGGQQILEIEFESYYAQYFFLQADSPSRGDLLWTSGRWIFDCAHQPYRTEIHPPFALAYQRTATFRGHPATEAGVWINSYYGGEPLEIDLYPPPRPSPDAFTLGVVKTRDSDAVDDVMVSDSWVDGTSIQLHFSAERRSLQANRLGKLEWPGDRGYEAQWILYWKE